MGRAQSVRWVLPREGSVKGRRPDMRKRLQFALMLTVSTAFATSFTLTTVAPVWAAEVDGSARGIATTSDHGRTIYVNDDAPAHERQTPAAQPKRSSFVYWSSKE